MAQEYQSIGQASPELEAVAAQHQGWAPTVSQPTAADTPTSLGHEITDAHDFSQWDRRANKQLLGLNSEYPGASVPGAIPNMAGYQEPPMAALQVTPTADTNNYDMANPITGTAGPSKNPDDIARRMI